MPDTADPTFDARLPVSGDVDDLVVIFNLAVSSLRANGMRVDQLSALPGTHRPHRVVAVTSTKQMHYDDGTSFWLLNPASQLGGNPPTTVRPGAIPDEGTSGGAAHSDHRHGAAVGPPAASRPGDAGSDGTANTLAASDHVHPREPGDPATWFASTVLTKQVAVALVSGTYALAGYTTPAVPPVVGGQATLNAGRRWEVEARLQIGVTEPSNWRWYLGGGAFPAPIAANPGFGGGSGSQNDIIIPSCVRIGSAAGTDFDLFWKYDEQLWFVSQGRSVYTGPANAGDTVWIHAWWRV